MESLTRGELWYPGDPWGTGDVGIEITNWIRAQEDLVCTDVFFYMLAHALHGVVVRNWRGHWPKRQLRCRQAGVITIYSVSLLPGFEQDGQRNYEFGRATVIQQLWRRPKDSFESIRRLGSNEVRDVELMRTLFEAQIGPIRDAQQNGR